MTTAHDMFMARRAQLQKASEHWQKSLAYGRGDWEGDRALVLYHRPLTDKMEVWYELPNRKPEMVFTIDVADFDIDKLCAALHRADNRRKSVSEKMAEADAHNAKVQAENERVAAEAKAEFNEKLEWAWKRDRLS